MAMTQEGKAKIAYPLFWPQHLFGTIKGDPSSQRRAAHGPGPRLEPWEGAADLREFLIACEKYQEAFGELADELKQVTTQEEEVEETAKTETLEGVRIERERFKTMLTLERRENARLQELIDDQSQRNDRLQQSVDGFRQDSARLLVKIDELSTLIRARNPDFSLQQRFIRLAEMWKKETGHLSRMTRKCAHPAYQQIIGMGKDVVQFILQDLKATHSDWFWALTAITGENPIPNGDAGNVQQMTEAWLQWGRTQGHSV